MRELSDYQNPPGYGETVGQVMAWQPIKTAPSDGRNVIVWGGHITEPTVRAADGEWWRMKDNRRTAPTHWHPMPEPPALWPKPEAGSFENVPDWVTRRNR